MKNRVNRVVILGEDDKVIGSSSKRLLSSKRPPPFESASSSSRALINGSNSTRREDSDSSAYRIMVMNDEPDIVAVLKRGLEEKGFDVVGFTDPFHALSSFRRHQFDVALLDVRMPSMNGIELYKRMRLHDSQVIICFLTAFENYSLEFKMSYP
jgi:PleD family two-component response regulator